jgi:stress response protein YsnF
VKTREDISDGIPIAHEELHVDKKIVEQGRVRVATHVHERTARIQEELAREDVDVEWVDIDREVDSIPEIRTEGDTLIVPLFEEVLVVEKRLVLRQELRLTRRMRSRPYEAEIPLRRMEAEVERATPPGTDTAPRRNP